MSYSRLRRLRVLPWCTFSIICSNLWGAFAYEHKLQKEWLAHDGVNLIRLGPGILGTCKRIDLTIEDVGDFRVCAGEKNFSSVQNWVRTKSETKFGLPPVDPPGENQNKYYAVALDLYSSDRAVRDDLLMSIPLTARILGMNESDFSSEVNNLKARMTAYREHFVKKDGTKSEEIEAITLEANAGWAPVLSLDDVMNKSVSITVDSTDHWNIKGHDCDANGLSKELAGPGCALPGRPIGCLVGKFDIPGRDDLAHSFFIGKGLGSLPRGTGMLFLAANDDFGRKGFLKNHGAIHIKITYPSKR
jgi:hypothetical protein